MRPEEYDKMMDDKATEEEAQEKIAEEKRFIRRACPNCGHIIKHEVPFGYRKLPQDKPPLLSDARLRKAIGIETKRIFTLMDTLALDYVHHSWWNQWLLFRNAIAKKIIESPKGSRY